MVKRTATTRGNRQGNKSIEVVGRRRHSPLIYLCMPNPFFQIKLTFNTREKCPWFLEFHRHDPPLIPSTSTGLMMMTITFGTRRKEERGSLRLEKQHLPRKWFNLKLIRSHSIILYALSPPNNPPWTYYVHPCAPHGWMAIVNLEVIYHGRRGRGSVAAFNNYKSCIWPLSIAFGIGNCCLSSGV